MKKPMRRVWRFMKGKKTFLVGAASVAAGIAGAKNGWFDAGDSAALVSVGIAAATGRDGLNTVVEKLQQMAIGRAQRELSESVVGYTTTRQADGGWTASEEPLETDQLGTFNYPDQDDF